MPAGYLDENSRRRFPFADGATLRNSAFVLRPETGVLPDDAFLDATLLLADRAVTAAGLWAADWQTRPESLNLRITLALLRKTAAGALERVLVDGFVARKVLKFGQLLAFDFPGGRARLTLGPGLLRYVQALTVSRATFEVNPTTGHMSAGFSPTVLVPSEPLVSSLEFWNSRDALPVLEVDLAVQPEAVLQEGSNVDLVNRAGTAGVQVVRGRGTGLFDECPEPPPGSIRRLNGLSGEDFLFQAGDCYRLGHVSGQVGDRAPGLHLEHVCRPRCLPDELQAAARYVNRTQDGINRMSQVAEQAAARVTQALSVQAQPVPPWQSVPYLDAMTVRTLFNVRNYESVGAGIYVPRTEPVTVDLTAQAGGGIHAAPAPDTGWELHSGSARLQEDNGVRQLNPVLAAQKLKLLERMGLACRGSATVNFVLSALSRLTNSWLDLHLVSWDGDQLLGTAARHLRLNQSPGPFMYANVRGGWTATVGSGGYTHQLVLELFDTRPVVAGLTSLAVFLGPEQTADLAEWRVDRGPTVAVPITGGGKQVTVSPRQVDYPAPATLTLRLRSPGRPVSVTVSATLNVGGTPFILNLTFP